MNNHQAAIALIKAMTGQANILTIPRPFVDYMGNLDGALFLSQLVYWSDKGRDGWFYKTYAEWQEEICLSEYEIKKAVKVLVDRGCLETAVRRANGNPTVHYKLDFDVFSESFINFLQERKPSLSGNESQVSQESLTETTTETTPEKITPQAARAPKKKDDRVELVDGIIYCHSCSEKIVFSSLGDSCLCPNCNVELTIYEKNKRGEDKVIKRPPAGHTPRADFKRAPVDAFCELVNTTVSGERQRAQWGYQLQKAAEPRNATPAQVVQAIKQIPTSEYAWKTFTTPFQETFKAVLDVLLGRVVVLPPPPQQSTFTWKEPEWLK